MSSSENEIMVNSKRKKGVINSDNYKRNKIKKAKLMGIEHVNWAGNLVPSKLPSTGCQ